MRHDTVSRHLAAAAIVAAGLLAALPGIEAIAAERFVATAVNIAAPGPAAAGFVDIVVERWSTDAERDRLIQVLAEGGQEKLLSELQSLPRVGYFRTPNSIAYDLKFARKEKLDEGGEQIVIATDRYIGFWEARNRPRTIDYPFTLIEIRLGPDGVGEGKMSLATKISYYESTKRIALENYASQPVMLTKVRRERG
jgi:hypothetical protein